MAKDTRKERQREITLQKKGFRGQCGRQSTTHNRVVNVFTRLCCIRVLSGQEEVGLFVVGFEFRDMCVLDKCSPLSHIYLTQRGFTSQT